MAMRKCSEKCPARRSKSTAYPSNCSLLLCACAKWCLFSNKNLEQEQLDLAQNMLVVAKIMAFRRAEKKKGK